MLRLFSFPKECPLGDLPTIRHLKSTNAVVVDRHPLIGNTVLLDRRINLDVLNELGNHALGNGGVCVVTPFFQEGPDQTISNLAIQGYLHLTGDRELNGRSSTL